MTEYSFDTINQTQADAFTSNDTLLFPTGHRAEGRCCQRCEG